MDFNKSFWKEYPPKGYEYIYRYFDKYNKSYIGHTKKSLYERAGGKSGSQYLLSKSKFAEAIQRNGFDSFNCEILEIVLSSEVNKKEKEYIKKYDSKRNGYNSTYGGIAYFNQQSQYKAFCKKPLEISLNEYTNSQLDNLLNNSILFVGLKEDKKFSIDEVFMLIRNRYYAPCAYTYYAFEDEYFTIETRLELLILNFIDLLVSKKFTNSEEINDGMCCFENLGGDLLTSGCYDGVKIKLLNGNVETWCL